MVRISLKILTVMLIELMEMNKKQLIVACLIYLVIALSHTLNSKLYAEEKPAVSTDFATPYGNIQKGSTEEQVKQILGEPKYSKPYRKIGVWYYYFNENSRLFVYFRDGRVIDISRSEYEKI